MKEAVSMTSKHKMKQQMLVIEVVASFPEDLAQIINEGSYTKLQIFKILQINSLYWQKIP